MGQAQLTLGLKLRVEVGGVFEDKAQLSPAEAEIGAELGMTENHSKHFVGVKFRH